MFTGRRVACVIYANNLQQIADISDESRDLIARDMMESDSRVREIERLLLRNVAYVDDHFIFAYKHFNKPKHLLVITDEDMIRYSNYMCF